MFDVFGPTESVKISELKYSYASKNIHKITLYN